jgi:hypothetical protein
MKTCGGLDVQIIVLMTLALVGGGWSASRSSRFIPDRRTPGTHWIGGWVSPKDGLDSMEEWKFLTL